MVITREGSWTLISPRDQKRLLLLHQNYPPFLGTGRYKQTGTKTTRRCGASSDSGLSGSEDSDTDGEDTVNTVGSHESDGEFLTPLPSDEVEVRYGRESIEIELGSDIAGSNMAAEACAGALCNQFGSYFAHQILG